MSARVSNLVLRVLPCIVLPLASFLPQKLSAAPFVRGDVDSDRRQNITDAVRILGFLFLGDPLSLACDDAADIDDNGRVQITDAISLLVYLYVGGHEPAAPFAACGEDPTPDMLDCRRFDRCEDAGAPPILSTVAAPGTAAAGEPIAVSFRYHDADGDIQLLHVKAENALGTRELDLGARFLQISGSDGGAMLPLKPARLPYGKTTLTLELRDSRGHSSNAESVTIEVVSATPGGSAPVIHRFAPLKERWNRPKGLARTMPRFALEYSDSEGDIDRIRIRVALPSGEEAVTEHRPGAFGVFGPAGSAERSFFDFRANSPLGIYAIEVTLFDRASNASVPVVSSVELVDTGGEPSLTISGFSPASGLPGTEVVLHGSGFEVQSPEKNSVDLSELPVEVVSAAVDTLTVIVPEGAVTGPFVVENARGQAVSSTVFTVPERILLDPESAETSVGSSIRFRAEALAAPSRELVWKVNGVAGGRSDLGTVSPDGLYVSPAEPPPGEQVSVTAELVRDASVSASAEVTIVVPAPEPGAAWMLASRGGEALSADGRSGVIIPPGALKASGLITVRTASASSLPPPSAGMRTLGAVELGPSGTVFNSPVTIVLPLARFYPPGTMLPVRFVDTAGGGYIDEGARAEVLEDGERARASVGHFSTFSVNDLEAQGMAFLPQPSIASITSSLPLEEGRRVPILIIGQNFTPDMIASVVNEDGSPAPEISLGTLYGLPDRVGILLHIGMIQGIGSPGQPASRTYKLRLQNTLIGSAAEHAFQVIGLPELFVPSGGIAELSGEQRYSEARIAGTLIVPDGELSLRATGPITVTGIIDAHGEDGRDGADRSGGSPALTGGPGGFGREDDGCFLGIDFFGTCDFDGAEPENFGQHGSGCLGFPADPPELQGLCAPLDSGRGLPKGMGGIPGLNTTLLEAGPLIVANLARCIDGDSDACRDVILQQQELLFGVADLLTGRYTGRRGLGAGLPVPGQPTGGGGGGGAGRMQLHIPTGLFVAELELSLNGGGGGGGGGGGKGVRIATTDALTLTETRPDGSRMQGRISTEGGAGGRGSTQGALTLSPSIAGFIDLAEVSLFGMPAFPGGGAGGGGGGPLVAAAGLGVSYSTPDQLNARGGLGGEGGVTIIADNGLARSDVTVSHASIGASGVRLLNRPLFPAGEIGTSVTNRTFFRLHPTGAPGSRLEVRHQDGSSSELVVPPIGDNLNVIFPQGLSTITAFGLPEELQIHFLVLASDADGDGLSDADEAELRTDPQRPDTDNDGLSDAQEVILDLNPLRADTDNDGLRDARELALGADATKRDTDGDGVWDGAEIVLGTNPVNASSLRKSIPRGTLLAQAGGDLSVVDPASGEIGVLGRVDLLGYGLAIDASTNVLAAIFDRLALVDPLGPDEAGDLAQDDVGPFGNDGGAPIRTSHIAFNPSDEKLYGVEMGPAPGFQPTGQLVQVLGDTGVATRVGSELPEAINALAFDRTGKLFAAIADDSGSDRLVELNPVTGGITREIGSIGFDHVFGLAFAPGGELHGSSWVSNTETRILRLDIASGQGTLIATVARAIFGIAFMPCPAPCFLPATSTPVANVLNAVDVVDLDKDGKLDVMTSGAQGAAGRIYWLRGKGDGTFEAAVNFSVGSRPQDLVVVDLNSDGSLDLVTANQGSQNVSVLLKNGTGGFTRTDLAAGGTAFTLNSVAAGDLNGDHFPDLAAGVFVGVGNQGFGTGNVRVWINDGSGSFGAFSTVPLTDSGITSVAMADLNRDGRLDVIAGFFFGGPGAVLRGDGSGGFSMTALLEGESFGVNRFASADLDGDGAPELVLPFTESSSVGVVANDGAGGLSAPVSYRVDANPSQFQLVAAAVVADLTGDGKPDILTANKLTGTASVLLGGRSFATPANSPFTVGGSLVDVSTGDLNGDGRLDAVACDSNAGKIFVLLNSPSF